MKPTVIGSNEPPDDGTKKTVRPTVMPTTVAPQPDKAPVRKTAPTPTVMKPPEKNSEPQTPLQASVKAPTAIPGFQRKRIPVSPSELAQYNQGATMKSLEGACALVLATDVDNMIQRDVILWGNDLQARFGTLVSKSLELAQSPLLTKVAGHIDRMTTLLGSIKLKKVCGFEKSERGLLSSIFGGETSIETLAELTEAQVELDQLVHLLGGELHALLDLKDVIESNSKQIDEVGDRILEAAMASAFLADYMARATPEKQSLTSMFSDRSASLTATLAQIRSSDSVREIQIERPLRLINSVQHVAQVMLPGWLNSIVALRTMLEANRKPTVTEVGELGDQMQEIILELRKER